MLLAIWWISHRLLWAVWPLPKSRVERDKRLADRAMMVLRAHKKYAGTIRACDPYTSPMKIDADRPEILRLGIGRTNLILRQHSLPGHLVNALLRQMDPEVARQAKRAEALLRDEATPADGSKTPKPPEGA